ncbi:MAG: alpha/beta fold hydrolase [Mangrovibacterium sp.]
MKLYYREEGKEGKNIVIVHGLYGASDNWLTVGKKLAGKHHVYLVDQRNHGRSPNNDIHNYTAMKEDLAVFFKARGLQKAIIIGHSMGGKTVMAFAADYPELIEKLVVVDIAPVDYRLSGDNSQYLRHRQILQALGEVQQAGRRLTSRQEIAGFLKHKLKSRELVQFLLKNIYRDGQSGKFACRLNLEALSNSLDEIIGGVNECYFRDRIPLMNYPVLFIRGEKSRYIRDEDLPVIRRIYPEAVIVLIPGAGHWLHAEQPGLFMKTLENFI